MAFSPLESGRSPTDTQRGRARGTRQGLAHVLIGAAFLGLLAAGCDRPRTQGTRRVGEEPDSAPLPVVGGPCSYNRLSFRATVDSVFSDGALLVRPDTALTAGGRCGLVSEVGEGRWRVPGPAAGAQPTTGDSVEVAADVIVTGTCVPCSVYTRLLTGGDR